MVKTSKHRLKTLGILWNLNSCLGEGSCWAVRRRRRNLMLTNQKTAYLVGSSMKGTDRTISVREPSSSVSGGVSSKNVYLGIAVFLQPRAASTFAAAHEVTYLYLIPCWTLFSLLFLLTFAPRVQLTEFCRILCVPQYSAEKIILPKMSLGRIGH